MIYRFELRRQLPGALIWAAVISGVLLLMTYGLYPVFIESIDIMERYIASFPPEMIRALGLELEGSLGFESFFGMVYLYDSLLAAIMMTSAALSVFSREKRDRCSDFLFTKPIRRSRVFMQKLLCCLTLAAIVDLPFLLSCIVCFTRYSPEGGFTDRALLCSLCLPLTQLIFLSAGMFLAVYLRRVRSCSGLAAGVGMFAFMLSIIHSLTENDIFRLISPLYYFSPEAVADTGGYDPVCAAAALLLTAGLAAAACTGYTRADLPV